MTGGAIPDDSWSALRGALTEAALSSRPPARRLRARSRPGTGRAGGGGRDIAQAKTSPVVAPVPPEPAGARNDVAEDVSYRALVDHSPDMVLVVAADGTVSYATPSVERALGLGPGEIRGGRFADLLHPDDAPRAAAYLLKARRQAGTAPVVEWRLRAAGGWKAVETVCTNLLDDPEVAGLLLTARDVDPRRAIEARLAHQAFHDPLTDLANRALLKRRIVEAFAASRPTSFALLFLDLDNFKTVNDSLGHAVGDELLVAVAERVRSCLRPGDVAARLGGDEFAVLLPDPGGIAGAIAVAERIIDELATPFALGGRRTFVQTSIGIAASDCARDADELLRNADIAMYRAKGTQKGTCAVFRPEMHGEAAERLELESDLRAAIMRDELALRYQPVIAFGSGRIVGLEALVRWNHPTRGLLAPESFIGIAEETGLIQPLGRWVIVRSVEQLGEWRRALSLPSPLSISVNLSSRQLDDSSLVALVDDAVRGAGVEPNALMLEITESAMMRDAAAAATRLHELKQLGVRLALDDFGTGYSSLHYLHSFPIDLVKVAKPFVDGLGEGSSRAVFTQSIIELCRTLGLSALAEGVETQEQARALRALRCDLGQGFYLSEPLCAQSAGDLLTAGTTLERYASDVLGRSAASDDRWWLKVTGRIPSRRGPIARSA